MWLLLLLSGAAALMKPAARQPSLLPRLAENPFAGLFKKAPAVDVEILEKVEEDVGVLPTDMKDLTPELDGLRAITASIISEALVLASCCHKETLVEFWAETTAVRPGNRTIDARQQFLDKRGRERGACGSSPRRAKRTH